jgi:hypothetical protein
VASPDDRSSPTARRFNEREVADIIKRASELQLTETPAESTSGMSLVELEQVAREAGLDPVLVRRAAEDLDAQITTQRPSRFIGAPTALCLERTIDGEISSDEYEPLVLEIQRVLGDVGTASMLGRSLQWSATRRGQHGRERGSVQLFITPRHGRTTIRIEESMTPVAAALFGGLMGGMGGGLMPLTIGLGLGQLHSVPGALGMSAGVVALAYGLARTIYGRVVTRRGARLHVLMERMVDRVAATASPPPPAAPAAPRGLEPGR